MTPTDQQAINDAARAAGELFVGPGPRVTFKHPFIPIDVLSYPSSVRPGEWSVKVVIKVKDVETGEDEYISQTEVLVGATVESPPRADQIAKTVKRLLVDLLSHEVDEMLHVDGVRAFEPHPPEVT